MNKTKKGRRSCQGREKKPIDDRFREIEYFLKRVGATVEHRGDRAYYSPLKDIIVLPPVEAFETVEQYYGTSFHEHAHWTGHPSRLNRLSGRFGTRSYAAEELVAELTTAFLCTYHGLPQKLDHGMYCASWIRHFKDHHKALHAAAAKAQEATLYLVELYLYGSNVWRVAANEEYL